MKIIIITLFFALSAGFIHAQNISDKGIFNNVETGSKRFYNLKTKDGNTIHARIVSVDKNQVLLINSEGNSITIPTEDVMEVEKKEYQSKGSIGLGFGLSYGILGINVDLPLLNNFYLSGGIGTGIFVTPMYNAGCKLFLRSGNYRWRPRISAYYGSNGMISTDDGDVSERFHGPTVGIGQQWTMGITRSLGFDFDILYIVDDSKFENRIEELTNMGYSFDTNASGNLKFAIGLRYCF